MKSKFYIARRTHNFKRVEYLTKDEKFTKEGIASYSNLKFFSARSIADIAKREFEKSDKKMKYFTLEWPSILAGKNEK